MKAKCVCVWARVCVRACVPASCVCVRSCLSACVHACVCVRARERETEVGKECKHYIQVFVGMFVRCFHPRFPSVARSQSLRLFVPTSNEAINTTTLAASRQALTRGHETNARTIVATPEGSRHDTRHTPPTRPSAASCVVRGEREMAPCPGGFWAIIIVVPNNKHNLINAVCDGFIATVQTESAVGH